MFKNACEINFRLLFIICCHISLQQIILILLFQFKPNRICITRSNYLQHNGYYISELPPGNYSLRVKANSLSKYGNWTAHVYFRIAAVSGMFSLFLLLLLTLNLLCDCILFYILYKSIPYYENENSRKGQKLE